MRACLFMLKKLLNNLTYEKISTLSLILVQLSPKIEPTVEEAQEDAQEQEEDSTQLQQQ